MLTSADHAAAEDRLGELISPEAAGAGFDLSEDLILVYQAPSGQVITLAGLDLWALLVFAERLPLCDALSRLDTQVDQLHPHGPRYRAEADALAACWEAERSTRVTLREQARGDGNGRSCMSVHGRVQNGAHARPWLCSWGRGRITAWNFMAVHSESSIKFNLAR